MDTCPAERRPAWRVLLTTLAVLALVVTGLAQGLSRAVEPATAAPGATVLPLSPAGRTSMEAPQTELVVRAAPLAVVPAPTGPAGGSVPAGVPLVAPQSVLQPQTRPSTALLPVAAPGAPGSRAPPGTTART